MYFTYVVRPGEAPEGRGPQLVPFWEVMLRFTLRAGFLFQAFHWVSLRTLVWSGKETFADTLDFLKVSAETVGKTHVFCVILSLAVALIGVLCHVVYVAVADDDGSIKQSRGYRTGVKFMQQAVLYGVVSTLMTLIAFYQANYYFHAEWMHDHIGSGVRYIMYYGGRLTEVLSLLLYGTAVFFKETYHSEGAGEIWGWLVGLGYFAAAICEVLALFFRQTSSFVFFDRAYGIILGLTLVGATAWAFIFEPISQRYDVRFTQSAMRSEYYKSRNAIAYYGPAVVNADGELDFQATSRQAQNCAPC